MWLFEVSFTVPLQHSSFSNCEDMLAWSKSWRWLCCECMFRAVKTGVFFTWKVLGLPDQFLTGWLVPGKMDGHRTCSPMVPSVATAHLTSSVYQWILCWMPAMLVNLPGTYVCTMPGRGWAIILIRRRCRSTSGPLRTAFVMLLSLQIGACVRTWQDAEQTWKRVWYKCECEDVLSRFKMYQGEAVTKFRETFITQEERLRSFLCPMFLCSFSWWP